MAGGTERILKRRIKSVQSTKKITRAMELIAASRIVRAQQRVAAARPYSDEITKVIENLAAGGAGLSHPLLEEKAEVRTVGYVVITADRGLAGAYNASVIRAAERSLKRQQADGKDYSLVLVGKKGLSYFRYRNYKIDASFEGMSDQPTYEDARQVAAKVIEAYEEGRVDRVELVFTRFLSVGSQRPVVHRFIPLDRGAIEEKTEAHEGPRADYEFEPEPAEILSRLLPRYVEARLFSAMLDAAASEHAARQRAMKAATDNAEDLITRLSRQMNRARQDAITTEIMEIVGGAEALRQGKSDEKDYFVDTVVSRDVLPDQIDPSIRRP
ncbi:MAG: F-type H+-transporting ATPase subunit gamma [Actinomycetota bacterium]|nr:F-type H+-transporting ATPase subunit gamma [Actinomycetota bacterium]